MSVLTEVLKLFKYDPATDGDMTFNIGQCMNDNWDKLDAAILLAIAAAGAYNPEESYAVGDYCTYKGKLHKCSTAIPTGEAWTEAHWTTTTVAAELAELSSQLSNRVLMPVQIPADADLNTLRTPGFYWCDGATNANRPDDSGSFCLLIEKTGSWGGNDVKQTFTNYDSGAIYTRVSPKDIWNPWRLLATATPPQEFDLPLADNWTNQQASTYFKTQEGIVVARIAIKSTAEYTSGGLLFKLPEGFRPSENVEFPCTIKRADNLQASSIYFRTSGAASENHSGGAVLPVGTELYTLAIFIAAS